MQTLTQIKALLESHGLEPKHRFGQNFLHDANQMSRILKAAALAPEDLVLEVGPGTGALSEWILEGGARLVAVEVDGDLEPLLRAQFNEAFKGRFTLVIGDVLAGKHHINPAAIEALRQAATGSEAGGGTGGEPAFKMIANLPYNVASPLLANLVVDHPAMTRAVVMVQREVADRLTAAPGGKEYGPLGVMIQAMCEVERMATLSPGCFWPRPQVDSAVVSLVRRAKPLTDNPAALASLLQRVFGQRRKQLGTTLGRTMPLPDGIDPTARPEQLSVAQLVSLSRQFGVQVE